VLLHTLRHAPGGGRSDHASALWRHSARRLGGWSGPLRCQPVQLRLKRLTTLCTAHSGRIGARSCARDARACRRTDRTWRVPASRSHASAAKPVGRRDGLGDVHDDGLHGAANALYYVWPHAAHAGTATRAPRSAGKPCSGGKCAACSSRSAPLAAATPVVAVKLCRRIAQLTRWMHWMCRASRRATVRTVIKGLPHLL